MEPNSSDKASSSNSHGGTSKTIKSENSTTRLTSFRVPRDLTLGGNVKIEKAKKVYTPNLNVQRKKKGEADVPVVKTEKERDRHKNSREHLKAKKVNNLIQSAGVFSEGISDITKKRYARSSYSRESSSDRGDSGTSLEKPKLHSIPTINKEEEDERLRLLLRDDFIDDNKEISLENAPTILPLNNPKNIYEDDYATLFNKKEFKQEVDIKPVIENGEIKKSPTKASAKFKWEEQTPSVLDVLENKSNSNYIFMQFPTCLPVLRSEEDSAASFPSKKQTSTSTNDVNKTKTNDSIFSNIKEGCIGKMQLLKSGKARLILGGHKFNVEKGTSTSFRQDLIAMQLNEEEKGGDLINLGPVNHTLIVSVDLESLLDET